MPTPADRALAQAVYLKELHTSAKEQYTEKTAGSPPKPFPLPVDPQGRVILDVSLDDNAWKRIYKKVEKPEVEVEISQEMLTAFKSKFAAQLGHPITPTTSISWDIQSKHS